LAVDESKLFPPGVAHSQKNSESISTEPHEVKRKN